MTTEPLTEFLGWASVVNIVLLLLTTIMVIATGGTVSRIYSGLFGLDEKDLGRAYFQYIALYKIAIIVFNVAPYIASRSWVSQ